MLRSRRYTVTAVVLVILLVFWGRLSETPPPVRAVPPHLVENLKEEHRLRNEKWASQQLIESVLLLARDANIGDFFRSDTTALIEPLRVALQANNTNDIVDKKNLLDERHRLLSGANRLIQEATEFLSVFGSEISSSLNARVRDASLTVQLAMKGRDWNELRNETDNLSRLLQLRLYPVKYLHTIADNVHALGTKVNPKLKQQIEAAIRPLQDAIVSGTLDQVEEQYVQLPELSRYPGKVFDAILVGRRWIDVLEPSERHDLFAALGALDTALQGESWEHILAQVDAIGDVARSIEQRLGPYYSAHAPCVRILTIDGGGIRGIIPAIFLAEIERRTGKPIAELFDYIVGTSTGGVIALGLTIPDPKNSGKPLHTASDLVMLYEKEGATIFPAKALKTIRGYLWPKYGAEGIERVLKNYFGDVLLRDALTNVVIPVYLLEGREGIAKADRIFLESYREISAFIYMWEAARATSAAPTYFPPFQIPLPATDEKGESRIALIDGGVFANNPAPHALSIVKKREYEYLFTKPYDYKHPLLLLSLGTGKVPRSTTFRDAWNWGVIGWSETLVDIAFSDPSIESETEQMVASWDYYARLQPTLAAPMGGLDNANETNIQALKDAAHKYLEEDQTKLDKLVTNLKRERPKDCARTSPF